MHVLKPVVHNAAPTGVAPWKTKFSEDSDHNGFEHLKTGKDTGIMSSTFGRLRVAFGGCIGGAFGINLRQKESG